MSLQFCRSALQDDKPANSRPTRENVDFESEPGKVRGQYPHLQLRLILLLQVHLLSSIIFNGVCVNWVGWIDLETLNGKARLAYNEEMAKVRISSSVFDHVTIPSWQCRQRMK